MPRRREPDPAKVVPETKRDRSRAARRARRARKPGAPAKLWSRARPAFNAEIQAQIIAFAAAGVPRKYAAMQVGIGETTLKGWVADGRQNLAAVDVDPSAEVDKYGAFLIELMKAEALARGKVLMDILREAKTDWRAGAWYLERMDHRVFGQVHKFEPVGQDDEGNEVSATEMLMDRMAAMIERRERAASGKRDDDED